MLIQAADIANYMRALVDDPDAVFLSPSRLAAFLDTAYTQFRSHLPDESFEVRYDPAALAAQIELDLSGILFGFAATQPRCQRITRVMAIDSASNFLGLLQPAGNFEGLFQAPAASLWAWYGSARWWLDGRALRFSAPYTGAIRIMYLPDSTLNWTTAIAAGNAAGGYVDDFGQWHDIIARMAAQDYYAADGKANAKLDQTLALRLQDMDAFVARGRSGLASNYVRDIEQGGY